MPNRYITRQTRPLSNEFRMFMGATTQLKTSHTRRIFTGIEHHRIIELILDT